MMTSSTHVRMVNWKTFLLLMTALTHSFVAWSVCELALLLSHGQASVERGFSVNKELVVENQSEQTVAARRIIKDHIIHVNGVTNVEITRNMVLAARSARVKYANYLAQQKEEQEVEKRNKKKRRN